ncbi:MAG: hypothetical protein HOU81_15450 [Hamadaea sp.]|uniref:hypothetical protein n=1 Tax=Hamadaea sp. TaxID=2024425 RepID=UPI0017AB90A6|nr:hypothetical protein [Hamadaea sp.]NUR72208.1 hypothetical protein [Hamadaea sp.]NUT22101.1 hypothetical protein [Hamadaea sp.]
MAKTEATRAAIETESELAEFAAQQVEHGRDLWLTHQMQVGGGICAACGHVYPCEDAEHAAWLVVYWARHLP